MLRWAALEVAAHAAHRLEPRPLDEPASGPERELIGQPGVAR